MNRGHFFAASVFKELNGYGGWGHSDNLSKPVADSLHFNDNKFEVIIDTAKGCTWNNQFNGVKIYVVNTSADTCFLMHRIACFI